MNLLYTVTAFILGMLHALEPGHGKSVIAAYILGTKSDLKDAILLGTTITISHTAVIFLLGILSLYLVEKLNIDLVHDMMSVVGGLILIAVGVWIVRHYFHPHEHNVDTKKGVIALGLSAGLVPCPAALAVLLLSISSGNLIDGLIYVAIFSVGLAISLTGLAVAFVESKELIKKYIGSRKITKLPLITGGIIISIGIYTAIHPIIECIV
ncbi:HoxN/HupN/NixA family nickel/cobalt transporter [Methanocaldococcus fervens]|uniref:High-affinity nickel-transporter n=1 Tax=Methanocaldococcus fervens (strain DSM 4213 / JCM 15782 / AG86) TaxID=573064 RepID=C7P9B6_METFA|nr:sulfite exporter TauE/SafE family protein [Methanocaldococcus fervens]ACV25148.1 high-affinity nickel-transporter [Methanocaldococcus fervens AG86]